MLERGIGGYAATAYSYNNNTNTAYAADNWLISPAVELGGVLKFFANTATSYPDSYEVLLSTTGTEIADFTETLQAMAAATHEMKLQAAGEWAKGVFEKDPEKLQCVLCAIKATSEHHFGRISIKSGKYLYTFDVDSAGDIRIKTKYTDTQEETF